MPRDRNDLIRALEAVFTRHGYEGATLNALSRATGLGKASLYHHFPGGKTQMARVLIEHAIADLDRDAFGRLVDPVSPDQRLHAFVDGFSRYVHEADGHCLIAVLAQGSLADHVSGAIAEQFSRWEQQLTDCYRALGRRPKAARREAGALLNQLYGALLLAKMIGAPKRFRRAVKRLHKTIDTPVGAVG